MNNLLVRLIGWKATVLHGDPIVLVRWKWLKRYLKTGPLRTLDAGSGSGAFTIFAAKNGNESIGISNHESRNQKARTRARILKVSNIKIINLDLRDLDKFSDQLGKFDQIMCCETIEHISDDRKLMRDLSNLLKPGGTLLITTPFKHRKRIFAEEIPNTNDEGHVRWGYTHEELRRFFKENGLDVVAEEFICGFLTQQLTQFMRILNVVNTHFAWIVTFPLRIFQIFDILLHKIINKFINYPYFNIGIVGIKKRG